MNNEERDRELYKYPGSHVLRNKLNIRDYQRLADAEAELVRQRMEEGVPGGDFDLNHLRAIHRHLFQDVYEWAGELRQVDFHKGGSSFLPHGRIETGMADVHKRLVQQKYLRAMTPDKFAEAAGIIMGDVNLVHPFREGNGRTQLHYLKQLGAQSGHTIDLTEFDRDAWIKASRDANHAEYERMADCIRRSIID